MISNKALHRLESQYMANASRSLANAAPTPEPRPDQPSDAVSVTWKNGIVHKHQGDVDTYELKATTSGVPSRITASKGGLFGPDVTAVDAGGKQLEAHSELRGFHRVLVATDPDTGLQTELDPRYQTLDIQSPVDAEFSGCMPFCGSVETRTAARQVVDAEGNTFFFAHDHQVDASVFPVICGDFASSQSIEATVLPAGSRMPAAERLEASNESGFFWGLLPCCIAGSDSVIERSALLATPVDASGRFGVVDPYERKAHQHQLFVAP